MLSANWLTTPLAPYNKAPRGWIQTTTPLVWMQKYSTYLMQMFTPSRYAGMHRPFSVTSVSSLTKTSLVCKQCTVAEILAASKVHMLYHHDSLWTNCGWKTGGIVMLIDSKEEELYSDVGLWSKRCFRQKRKSGWQASEYDVKYGHQKLNCLIRLIKEGLYA